VGALLGAGPAEGAVFVVISRHPRPVAGHHRRPGYVAKALSRASHHQARPTRPGPVWAIMTELNGGLEVFGVRLAAVTGARNRSAALAASASSAATRSRRQGVTRSGLRVQEMGDLNDTATAVAMLAMSRSHR
jgi:hypothetical protein